MQRLPSIQGLRDTSSITVRFNDELFQLIEQQCRAEWLELHRIVHSNETASPFVPYNELIRTREGHMHMWLLDKAFYILNTIPGNPRKPYAKGLDLHEYSTIMSRLQAQRFTTRGTRRRFEKRVHSATDYRKFRNWWINRHYSALVGIEFSEPCPYDKYEQSGPTESYIEIGHHFEEWTGYKLPKELWDELKKDEAERLAKQQQQLQAA